MGRRRQRVLTFVVFLAGLALPAGASFAQADQDTLLPDLAPREMEILGNLEITFPQLRRQPLSGFNPPPRIYEVPRGWRPWTGDYKQPSADLPGTSLIQPVSPPATISVGQHPHKGELSLGIGRYLSREVRAQAAFDLGPNVVMYGSAFHEGLDKFEPFDDTLGTEAPEQNYDGVAGLTYRSGATSAGVEVSGFFRELDLYGARADTAPFASPERDGQGFGGKVWVATGETSKLPVLLSAEYRANTFETSLTGAEFAPSVDGSLLAVAGETKFGMGGRSLQLDGQVSITGQEGIFAPLDSMLMVDSKNDVTTYRTGGELRIETGKRSVLRVGAQMHGYSVSQSFSAVGLQTFDESKLYVAPRISFVNMIASGTEIYVKNTPIVLVSDQSEMFRFNPFLVDGALALPELSVVNVEGGIVFYKGPVRVAARSGITTYESLRYFAGSDSPFFGPGFFDVHYGNADVLFAGGDIGVTFPGQFSATISGQWQSAKLDNDLDVPYYPKFDGGLRASYVFADDRALLQVDGKFVGERNVDAIASRQLSGYVDMAFLGSYYFENGVGIFGRVHTMTGDTFERWDGYPVADWVTLGGIRLRW